MRVTGIVFTDREAEALYVGAELQIITYDSNEKYRDMVNAFKKLRNELRSQIPKTKLASVDKKLLLIKEFFETPSVERGAFYGQIDALVDHIRYKNENNE